MANRKHTPRLTKTQMHVLRLVESGEFLTIHHLEYVNHLESLGLVETVNSGFISMVHLRVTDAGRAALAQEAK